MLRSRVFRAAADAVASRFGSSSTRTNARSLRPLVLLLWIVVPFSAVAARLDIEGPPGSEAFGRTVLALPSGNLVVGDPMFDSPDAVDVGAVFVYGPGGELISTLSGSTAGDMIGSGGLTLLSDGDFVVLSPDWDNGTASDAGALSWGHGVDGIAGNVGASNSLLGSSEFERVGSTPIVAMPDGSFIAVSPSWNWNSPAVGDIGAATWIDPDDFEGGEIDASNSIIGAQGCCGNNRVTAVPLESGGVVLLTERSSPDFTGFRFVPDRASALGTIDESNSTFALQWGIAARVVPMQGSRFALFAPSWSSATTSRVGAVAIVDGGNALGEISPSNALVGSTANDQIGSYSYVLANDNVVIASWQWNNGAVRDAGAVTWIDGDAALVGPVSASNSLVGTSQDDNVGAVMPMDSGDFLVRSPSWDNGSNQNAGALTRVDGSVGLSGPVSSANSLVGTRALDRVGLWAVDLSAGRFAVASPHLDADLANDVGAVTVGSGPTSGAVSASNSLTGSSPSDRVGSGLDFMNFLPGVISLSNGDLVVCSPYWRLQGEIRGAITRVPVGEDALGAVSDQNSLIGPVAGANACSGSVKPLKNGAYLVLSPAYNVAGEIGAITKVEEEGSASGIIGPGNSLVGAAVVASTDLSSIPVLDAGDFALPTGAAAERRILWFRPDSALIGAAADLPGLLAPNATVESLAGVHYLVRSRVDAESGFLLATTFVRGSSGTTGTLEDAVSVVNTHPESEFPLAWTSSYDAAGERVLVGREADNAVSLLSFDSSVAVSIPQNPAVVGKAVELDATVLGSRPSGVVTFFVDGAPIEECTDVPLTVAVDGSTARCTVLDLPTGEFQVGATYGGDSDNDPAPSATVELVVGLRYVFEDGFE